MADCVPAYAVPIQIGPDDCRAEGPSIEVPLIQRCGERLRWVDKGADDIAIHLLNLSRAENLFGFLVQAYKLYMPGLGFQQGTQSTVQIHVCPSELKLLAQAQARQNGQPSPWREFWSNPVA